MCQWALDSGGFSELSLKGEWTIGAAQYAGEVRRWSRSIGLMQWAAIQDWMCEPFVLAKTGLSVAEHQARTIRSYLDLRSIAPDVPWAPVLQGWQPTDYIEHAEAYARAGIDLESAPIVGVGSVCRRQATAEGAAVFCRVAQLGLRIHAFGIKRDGLEQIGELLESADSMAWSYVARRRKIRLDGCDHARCNNCYVFAQQWASRITFDAPVKSSSATIARRRSP